MDRKTGKVYIVGAGCGKADLITVRGMHLLEKCTAVVYDDLIAPELLDAAPASAERIYMGKRSGRHSAAQEEICLKLISLAEEGHTVVRLKGGDPFVFGRGGEEIIALNEAGIPCEEVPGISSAIAIPAAAGIPVTHRGMSRSVHIITAHTADSADGLPEYMTELAKLPGTLVFLMGLAKLRLIAERLVKDGMSPDTPAAVLSGGNSAHPATVRGTLTDIADRADEAHVMAPAVIVVGKTAALDLSSTLELPLKGRRVGVTGTAATAERLASALESLGAETVRADASVVRACETGFDYRKLTDGVRKLVVYTSSNGVRVFFEKLREARIDVRELAGCSFAVIGAATGKTLAGYGIYADICPGVYTSEALADEIERQWDGGDICVFRSAQGSELLVERLSARYCVKDIHTYTVEPDRAVNGYDGTMDYICFSSAGGVRLYMERFGKLPEKAVPVCIGEVTRAELCRYRTGRIITADACTVEGIVEAVLRDISEKQ